MQMMLRNITNKSITLEVLGDFFTILSKISKDDPKNPVGIPVAGRSIFRGSYIFCPYI